jgi:WD40 repeat protein
MTYFTDIYYPVVSLVIDKEEKFVFCGSSNGSLFVYRINDSQWSLQKVLFDSFKEICWITVSNNLNVFASGTIDGFVNLYTFPEAKLFRSISTNGFPVDKVFLSASPLPCVIVFSKSMLTVYGINGNQIVAISEESDILTPKVFTDANYIDYIV